MLRCKEVVHLVASEELAESGWMKRLTVRMHLAMCRHCRRYAKQIRELGRAAREIWTAGVDDEDSIRRIEAAIAGRFGGAGHLPGGGPGGRGDPPPSA
jgi:hypothetical protein